MRIKKLQLKNGYKRFRDLTIDLGDNPARIVALVGPNGCGKSSVLDGMLFYQSAYARVGGSDIRRASYHFMDDATTPIHQNVSIEFVEGSYSAVYNSLQDHERKTLFHFAAPIDTTTK